MRNLLLTCTILVLCSGLVWSQKKNVRQAEKIATSDAPTTAELQEALTLMESAQTDEKTGDDENTYYVLGQLYGKIAKDSTNALMPTMEALEKAQDAFQKAKKMEGGDGKYTSLIDNVAMQDLYYTAYTEGAEAFGSGNYEDAVAYFEMTQEFMPTDTNSYINAGNAAINVQDYETAADNFYEALELGYEDFDLYYKLIVIESQNNDNVEKAIELLETAKEKFPNEPDLGKLEIDILIKENRVDEAIARIEKEIENDPDDINLRFRLASLYYNLALAEEEKDSVEWDNVHEYYTNAIQQYKDILEIDPNNFNANYFAGLLYLYDAKIIYDQVNALEMKEYMKVGEQRIEEADNILKNAIPYLEKAVSLQPDNVDVLRNLQIVYTQLKMKEKADEIYSKLEAMGYYDDEQQ